jgi:hypothetical protein
VADSDADKCVCEHERFYHQGSGSLFNATGCTVTYCRCKKFRKAES